MSEVQVRERSGDGLRCPFCHDEVAEAAATRCGECNAPHHTTCFAEHAACGACSQTIDVTDLATSRRQCAFHDDCEANAIEGDALCPTHRREVAQGGRDLRPTRDEALTLVRRFEQVGKAMAAVGTVGGGVLLSFTLKQVFAWDGLTRIPVALGTVVVLYALSRALLSRLGRLRTLLEAIPDDALAPHPGTVRVSVKDADAKSETG